MALGTAATTANKKDRWASGVTPYAEMGYFDPDYAPEDTDILVVPPDLREDARNAVKPGTPILVTPASAAAGAFAELVKRLEAGTDFTAERIDPEEEKDKPKIVSYRGHTLLD